MSIAIYQELTNERLSKATKVDGSGIMCAGAGQDVSTNGADNMGWLSSSQRTTGVDYRGVQKTDDWLVKAFI